MSAVISNPACSLEVLLRCSVINAFVGYMYANILTIITWFVKWLIWFHDCDHLSVLLHAVEVKTFKADTSTKRCRPVFFLCVCACFRLVSRLRRSRGLSGVCNFKILYWAHHNWRPPLPLSHPDMQTESALSLSASASPGEKKAIPLPHLGLSTQSAGAKEINLGGCWLLLTYQPKSIPLTGTEMMALSLTGRVSEQQK